MVEVTVSDVAVGDDVQVPGRWTGTRPVARVDGDHVLTGTVEMGWRWEVAHEWLRARPYSEQEARWYAPLA